jgi:hypothetical protein
MMRFTLLYAIAMIIFCTSESVAQDYSKHPALGEFIGHIDATVFICHLSEIVVAMRNKVTALSPTDDNKAKSEAASKDAIKCSKEARDKSRVLYSNAVKEVRKKSSAEIKLKSVLASWLSIMSAIPRSNLSEYGLKLEQEKDKKSLREKTSEFEAEFFF